MRAQRADATHCDGYKGPNPYARTIPPAVKEAREVKHRQAHVQSGGQLSRTKGSEADEKVKRSGTQRRIATSRGSRAYEDNDTIGTRRSSHAAQPYE